MSWAVPKKNYIIPAQAKRWKVTHQSGDEEQRDGGVDRLTDVELAYAIATHQFDVGSNEFLIQNFRLTQRSKLCPKNPTNNQLND